MKARNLAMSTVLSTVILASALLVIVGIASFAANNVVAAQMENAQFDQAKNVLESLDQAVKRGMFTTQSYGYVRSSFWNTIPQFTETGENLTVTIVDNGKNLTFTYRIPINIIKIKGGANVGVLTPKILLGDASNLLTNASGSLGRIKLFQSNGAWVSLDYSRARCVYAGSSSYYNGTGWDEKGVNTFEITLMNTTFGVFEPGNQAYITVQNLGTKAATPIQVSNNTIVQVSLTGEQSSESCELAELVRDQGGDPEKPGLVKIVTVNIEISMLKGA